MYDNVKSQCAYMFYEATITEAWSMETSLLERMYIVGKSKMKLYAILQQERKAIKKDESKEDRGWCLIHKEMMKNKLLVGHSPDFIEGLLIRWVFELKKRTVEIPKWCKPNARNGNILVRRIGFKRV